jgi:hypothetical protein
MYRIILIILIAATGFIACTPLSTVQGDPKATESSARIAFATFTAMKTSDGTISIELIDWQLVAGQIKPVAERPLLHPVQVTLENANHRSLLQFQIENPLVEDLEYADDQGKMHRMVHSRDSAGFFLRLNYPKEMEFIRFSSEKSSLPRINATLKIKK